MNDYYDSAYSLKWNVAGLVGAIVLFCFIRGWADGKPEPLSTGALVIFVAACIWKWHSSKVSRASWVPVGISLGFKSVYSGKVPVHPFASQSEVKDALLRERPSDQLYIGVWLEPTERYRLDGHGPGQLTVQMVPEATFALFQMKGVYLPAFEIRPRVTVEKLLPSFLESQPDHNEFRHRYALLAPDGDAAGVAGLLPGPFLDRVCELPDWQIRSSSKSLLLLRKHRLLDSEGLPEFVQQADALLTALIANTVSNATEPGSDSISV